MCNPRAMVRCCVLLACLAAGFCDFSIRTASSQAVEPAKDLSPEEFALLQEYQANYQRLKEFYNNVRIEGILQRPVRRVRQRNDNPPEKCIVQLVFRTKGARFFRVDGMTLEADKQTPAGRSWVILVRPGGYLWISRDNPQGQFRVTRYGDDPSNAALPSVCRYCRAAYYNYVSPMEKFVFKPIPWAKVYEREVQAHEEVGERLVTITLRAVDKREGEEYSGRFVFYRDRSWAMKECSWGFAHLTNPEHGVREARCEYEGTHNGIPLLKRVEYWTVSGPQRTRTAAEIFEVRSIEVGPVNDEEFTVEALGLRIGKRPSAETWHI